MASILRVRNGDGSVIDIPALIGKNAYEYAKDGGYTGTESEFTAKLAEDTASKTYVDNAIGDINAILDEINGEAV